MNIYFNNEKHQIEANQSLQEFLLCQKKTELHFAIAINHQFVPRGVYQSTLLNENDRIDMIVPMQGG